MKAPKGLKSLLEDGRIDQVLRQLKSGKEAAVYVVSVGEVICCAKVYKEAQHRGFHKLAQYQEGRKTRSSRDTRALGKRSRHSRSVQESEWKNAEIEALYRLAQAGVRVPKPLDVHDGVLLMELLVDEHGHPAPRLNEVPMSAEQARLWHGFMMAQMVRMLCAGLIHGDLSDYNVLVDANGPVIIDLPQAVNAASNNNAFAMLERDVNNMRTTFGAVAPELLDTHYALEIWDLFESSLLTPETQLSGRFQPDQTAADVEQVLDHIEAARLEAEARQRGREAAAAEAETG